MFESANGGRAKNARQQAAGQGRTDAPEAKLRLKDEVLAELMPQILPVNWHAGEIGNQAAKLIGGLTICGFRLSERFFGVAANSGGIGLRARGWRVLTFSEQRLKVGT